MATTISKLNVLLTASAAGFKAGLDKAQKQLGSFGSFVGGVSGGMDKFQALGRGVGDFLEIAGSATRAVRAFNSELSSDPAKAMKNVEALKNAIGTFPIVGNKLAFLFDPMIEGIRKATEQADAFEKKIQGAISETNALKAFGDSVAAQLSAATMTDSEKAAAAIAAQRQKLAELLKSQRGKDGKLTATARSEQERQLNDIAMLERNNAVALHQKRLGLERELRVARLRGTGQAAAAEREAFIQSLRERAAELAKTDDGLGASFAGSVAPQLLKNFDRQQAEQGLAAVRGQVEALRQSVRQFNMTDGQKLLDNLKTAGASSSNMAAVKALHDQLDAMQSQQKMQDELKASAEALYESTRTGAEKYAAELERINELLVRGMVDRQTADRAARSARASLLGGAAPADPRVAAVERRFTAGLRQDTSGESRWQDEMARLARDELAEMKATRRAVEEQGRPQVISM